MKFFSVTRYPILLILFSVVFLFQSHGVNSLLPAAEKESLFNHPEHKQWDRDMKIFLMKDEVNPTEPGCTIFVGSSSMVFWKLEKSFPGKDYLNRGFGGSEIADSIHFANILLLKHKPGRIVFYAGDNDIARKKSVERVVEDFKTFEAMIHENLPETKIFYVCIKPSISRWELSGKMKEANEKIQSVCEMKDYLEYIDIWNPMLGEDGKPKNDLFIKDGLHLNEKGYKLWTSVLGPYLE